MFLVNVSDDDVLEILCVDLLSISRRHPSHFWLPQSVHLAHKLNPKKTVFTDFSHSIDHYRLDNCLKTFYNIDMCCGYDGMMIPFSED